MSEGLTKSQRAAAWLASTLSAIMGASAVFIAGILWLGDIRTAAADAKAMGARNEQAVKDVKADIQKGFESLSAKIQEQSDQVLLLAGKIGNQEGRATATEGVINAEMRPQLTQIRESAAKVSADVAHVLESQREMRASLDRLLERLERPK